MAAVQTGGNEFKYEHDFALIRPGNEQTHRFDITNTSSEVWTVKEIQTNCSCTVPTITAQTIEPGKMESVDVIYTVVY